MKYLNKRIMAVLIGTSFITPPVYSGKQEMLTGLMDIFSTKSTPNVAKKFFTPSQFSSEKKIFSQNIFNPHLYRTLTDLLSRQKSSFVRHYSTSQDGPFLDPTNDVAFKKLFATENHKPLLVNFLNSLLRLHGKRTIKKVELLPTEQVPHIKAAKRTILDVKCTDQRNF